MKLVIGSANFLNNYGFNNTKIKSVEIKRILKFCKNKNIVEIDTSDSYDNFLKIKNLSFLRLKINTKINFDRSKIFKDSYVESIINKEFSKLKVLNKRRYNSILIHNFHTFDKLNEFYRLNEIMNNFKKIGLTKHFGVSIYEKKELKYLTKFSNLNIIQLPYNLLNKTFSGKILKILNKKYSIHVRSVFLQGLLLKDFNSLNKKFKKFKVLKDLQDWIDNQKLRRMDVMLSALNKDKKYINKIIVGIENLNQLKDINKSLKERNKVTPKFISRNSKYIIDPRSW